MDEKSDLSRFMTKREEIAKEIMAKLVESGLTDLHNAAELSVKGADILIATLKKYEGKNLAFNV